MAFMIYRFDFDLVKASISLYIQRSSIPVVINELLDKKCEWMKQNRLQQEEF